MLTDTLLLRRNFPRGSHLPRHSCRAPDGQSIHRLQKNNDSAHARMHDASIAMSNILAGDSCIYLNLFVDFKLEDSLKVEPYRNKSLLHFKFAIW